MSTSDYTLSTLPNGVRVISAELPHMQSVAIGVWAGVGGRYESAEENGMSHVLEHMNFKGTAKRNARQISESIEGIGGTINGFTSEEVTCYYAKVRYTKFSRAVDVLLDLYANSLFSSHELARECSVIKEEIRMYNDMPQQVAYENITASMWKNHPLGRSILGTFDTLDSFSHSTVKAFHTKHYSPENTVISVVGNISHEDVVEHVLKHTHTWKKSQKSAVCLPYKERQRAPRFTLQMRPVEQAHFVLGFKALNRTDPDRFALRLLTVILGENMSSRLHQDIREKHGLAYSVHAHTLRLIDTGAVMIACGTDPSRLSKACERIVHNIKRIIEKGVRKKELNHAKEYVRGNVALSMERTTSYMLWLGENLLTTNSVLPINNVLDAYDKITLEDIQESAARIFSPKKATLSVVSPEYDENALHATLEKW